jgi:hypothetical protein
MNATTRPKFNYTFYVIEDLSENPLPSYYGSTRQKLSKRIVNHRSRRTVGHHCSSKAIIDRGDYHYSPLEERYCTNLERKRIEAGYIRSNRSINKCVPAIIEADSEKEWGRQYKKEYYQTHGTAIRKRCRKHHQTNRTELLKKMKQYRHANREARRIYKKKYAQLKTPCIICGSSSSSMNFNRTHRRWSRMATSACLRTKYKNLSLHHKMVEVFETQLRVQRSLLRHRGHVLYPRLTSPLWWELLSYLYINRDKYNQNKDN